LGGNMNKKENETHEKSVQSFVSGIFLIVGILIIIVGVCFTIEMVHRQSKLTQQNAIVIDGVQYDLHRHIDKSEIRQLTFEFIGRLSFIFVGLFAITTSLENGNIFRNSQDND
jgi:putative exporter of polyketide antibiotics